ncbi:hypothetical protein [Ensifer adhaerens]|uniref:hypothetical protein n=1 Tax=Ensifer adhaerens TaxID=106592 RepID=UPI000DC49B68|nr:hypothetical protein [Ensifer adhaerens]RAR99024.1 hypothetical protein DEU52_15313 [Ensifer adhaerens]
MQKYRNFTLAAVLGTTLLSAAPCAGQDAGDHEPVPQPTSFTKQVTRASKDVPELVFGSASDSFAVNQKDFELIAGQGYRWKITSAAGLEYKFVTDLFRNVWMNQIVINDLEVHMNGAPAWLEFDAEGTMQVQFTTIRPGSYAWSVPDLADKGMKGTITIK